MKNDNNKRKLIFAEIVIILVIALAILLPQIVGTMEVPVYSTHVSNKTFDDVDKPGVRVGIIEGIDEELVFKGRFKNVTVHYYNTKEDMVTSLLSGNIDYCVFFRDNLQEALDTNERLAYIDENVSEIDDCFIVQKNEKGEKLCKQFDDYILKIKGNGLYQKIKQKWNYKNSENFYLPKTNFTGENGKLEVVTCGVWTPKSFYYNNELTGEFIEIVNGFCEEYGYIPNFSTAKFTTEIAGIATGRYDLMADVLERTPEREKTSLFTTPMNFTEYIFMLTEKPTSTKKEYKYKSFFTKFKNNIYNNFIREDRYLMILEGLKTTIYISLFVLILGTILASIVCFLRMNKNIYLNAFARIYIKTIQGTPIVVLLLILFYVVFNNTKFSATTIAIFGFSIDFSAYVSEIFRAGIESIDNGQKLAARSLGFSDNKAFVKVVLPQAIINILPVYTGQFISMVKLTSVAGYIAVVDLTKSTDLIRSRTYEAFFPLILTAVIYFVLASLLIQILKIIEFHINPKTRSRKVKGVTLNVSSS